MIDKVLKVVGLARYSQLAETEDQLARYRTVAEEVLNQSNAIIITGDDSVITDIDLGGRQIVIAPGVKRAVISNVRSSPNADASADSVLVFPHDQ